MAGFGPFNAYTDIPTFQGHAPGLSIKRFVGANTQLSAGVAVGAVSLPVLSSTGAGASQLVYVLDGAQSEIVVTSATTAAPDGTHIALQGTGLQFAHAAGASVSTAGVAGALGQLIFEASGYIENYCQQGQPGNRGLFSASHTEKLRMPTTRAFLDPSGSLTLRPRWFPIASVSGVTLEYEPGVTMALDATNVEIEDTLRSLRMPYPRASGSTGVGIPALLTTIPLLRGDQAWLSLTYTAGVAWSSMPWDLQMAANLTVRELLAWQQNPTGAAMLRQGDTMLAQRLRGSGGKESSIDAIYLSQSKTLLEAYKAQFV